MTIHKRSELNKALDQCPEIVQQAVWGEDGYRAQIDNLKGQIHVLRAEIENRDAKINLLRTAIKVALYGSLMEDGKSRHDDGWYAGFEVVRGIMTLEAALKGKLIKSED